MLNITVDPNDLKIIGDMLSDISLGIERVVYRALNKTIIGVRTDASAAIREVLNVKKEAVDETFKITKPQIGNMTAMITCTGKPLALIDFIGTRQTNNGVSVQIRRDGPRKVIPNTFIRTMQSGHMGVFWRKWHEPGKTRGKMEVAANRAGYAWSEKQQRFIAMAGLPTEYRLPMEERYAPRIPDYLVKGPVIEKILNEAVQRLQDNLDHETDYELSKHR